MPYRGPDGRYITRTRAYINTGKKAAKYGFKVASAVASAAAAQAVRTALGGGPSYTTGATTVSRNRTKKLGAGSSKSKGFTKTKTRVRYTKGKGRGMMVKTSKFAAQLKGVGTTFEAGGISVAKKAIYLGHITHPSNVTLIYAYAAVVKMLIIRYGNEVTDLNQTIKTDILGLDPINTVEFIVTYRLGNLIGDAILTQGFTNNTPYDVANAIRVFFQDKGSQVQWIKFTMKVFTGAIPSLLREISLPMTDLYITLSSKSSMKMQNRSNSASDTNEIEEVDNSPIYGKSYEGGGFGCDYIADNVVGAVTRDPFIGNENNGAIGRIVNFPVANTSDVSLQEPPEPSSFSGVSRSGKIHLDPGEIKTSVLSATKRMKFNDIFLVFNNDVSNRAFRRGIAGKFRFFGYEKMLETVQTDLPALIPMTVAWEINLKFDAWVSGFKNVHQTVRNYQTT